MCPQFLNHYKCPRCHGTWADAWDSTCDDRCPSCNLSCSPHHSEEIASSNATPHVTDHTARIREFNDQFRQQFEGNGRIVITPGIKALPQPTRRNVILALLTFEDFDADNERDFISVEVEGIKAFLKIDYLAPDLIHGSEDPSDSAKTVRVMTLKLAEEY